MRYIDPDGRETFTSSITEEQYNNSGLTKQYSWEQVQSFFSNNPNGALHRFDSVFYDEYENKKSIKDPNLESAAFMFNCFLGAKAVGSLLKAGLKFVFPSATGRVFWSGGGWDIAGKTAMEYAKANGKITLEMTFKGRLMHTFGSLLPKNLQTRIWGKLSQEFAEGAVGSVDVIINLKLLSQSSFWIKKELPTLLKKGVGILYYIMK